MTALRTMLEGLKLSNGAISEKIPPNFTPLLCNRQAVSFVERINLLQMGLGMDRQTERLLYHHCAYPPRQSPMHITLSGSKSRIF